MLISCVIDFKMFRFRVARSPQYRGRRSNARSGFLKRNLQPIELCSSRASLNLDGGVPLLKLHDAAKKDKLFYALERYAVSDHEWHFLAFSFDSFSKRGVVVLDQGNHRAQVFDAVSGDWKISFSLGQGHDRPMLLRSDFEPAGEVVPATSVEAGDGADAMRPSPSEDQP